MAEQKLVLHSNFYGYRPNKILITADYAGVAIERHIITEHSELKTPEYLKKHPLGKIPLLETPQGSIFESNAIVRYLARLGPAAKLYGSNDFEAAQIEQYLDLNTTEIEPAYALLVYPVFGFREVAKEVHDKANHDLHHVLKVLDQRLAGKNYLVGDHITIADIVIGTTLIEAFRLLFSEKTRHSLPNLTKWFTALVQQKHFVERVGKVYLATKEWHPATVAAPAAKEEKKKEAKKEEKPAKKEEKKKEEPKKEEKKPKKEEEEEDAPAEKKEKNPLDSLPPTTFDLYNFKTLFVNSTDRRETLKTFWEQYDPAGYSIWILHYQKAEGEGAKLFLTSNLANGFLQRLEHFRKYALGVHGVYGEASNLEIKGCWLWRGTGHPNEIKEQDTYEFHTFTEIDTKNPAHRKLVEDYWCNINEGDKVDGLTVQEVKYFK